jgi:mannose/fructose/N-acetylgalactosamine-specific phosphotransferase system component IIC
LNAWACDAAGAGVVALLELDAAAIGPFLLSRPIFIGPLVGWLFGSPWVGAVLGVVFEALTLEETPLGGRKDFSAPGAAGAAAWLAAGPAALPCEAAFLAGLIAGWAHAGVERRLRRGRGASVRRAEAALAAGEPPRLATKVLAALALQAASTFAVVLVALAAVGPAAARLWPALPDVLRAGARTAFLAAPWLGVGSLAAALWRRA